MALEDEIGALEAQIAQLNEQRQTLRGQAVQLAGKLDALRKRSRMHQIAQRLAGELGENVKIQTIGPDGTASGEGVGTPGT